MAFDAIEICFGELNMKAEDHIMKAVQQVDVNVDKEKLIEAIKSKDFVDELIGYIFAYPDDDYMTMECLCRKLHKYGLIDKKDGEWTTDFIERKTEPSNSEKPNNCEPKICDTCRYYNSNIPCGSTPGACKEADKFAEEFVDGLKKLKPTISKMEQVDKDINVRSKNEPQTNKDFKVTYTCSFTECDNFKNFGFGEKCIECKRKQSEAKHKDEPQTDCAWK